MAPLKLIRNRLTTSPLPLPRSSQRSVSPEVHAISSEWISLTVGGGGGGRGSPPAAPTPPLPPLPSVSYRWGEYLPPSLSASPVPPAPYSYMGLTATGGGGGSPYCGSPAASPSASPLPPPYPPRPSSATPFLTFTPPQGEDFLRFPPSSPRGMSPYGGGAGPGTEGWLRGGREGTDRDRREGDRGVARDGPGSWADPPAEVSSAWCAVLHRCDGGCLLFFCVTFWVPLRCSCVQQPPPNKKGLG